MGRARQPSPACCWERTVVAQPVDADAQVVFSRALCAQLRDARRRLGLTQAQLSARTGGLISKAALANYETGHRSMRVDIFWALARALDTEPGILMAAAERSAGMTADAQSPGPVTIDIPRLVANADPRLAARPQVVRASLPLQPTGHRDPGHRRRLRIGGVGRHAGRRVPSPARPGCGGNRRRCRPSGRCPRRAAVRTVPAAAGSTAPLPCRRPAPPPSDSSRLRVFPHSPPEPARPAPRAQEE